MSAERLLRFDPERSAGQVFFVAGDGRRVRLGAARGEVRLPHGAKIGATLWDPDALDVFGVLRPGELDWLDLHRSRCLDHHLAPLRRHAGLREVNLSKASLIADAGLTHLRHMWALRELDLYRTAVTDAGLSHLRGLRRLERLHLGMTRIQGHGLLHLAGLHALRWISLEDTAVDDATVGSLVAMPFLRDVVVRGTRLTRAGLLRLRGANPGCRIHGEPEHRAWRVLHEERRRETAAILVRRADPVARVSPSSSGAEIDAALREAFPTGTRLSAVLPGGTDGAAPTITSGGWETDPTSARRLDAWLDALPPGSSIRVVRPAGGSYEFPWIRTSPTLRFSQA
ncbi:MAG TPA: hypothetical protein VIC87_00885 [Vicinamibacteria bacterium]|jgi:hypothetical protein